MAAVYFDHNATTPVDPVVLDAMLPFLREDYGNPSSSHKLGQRARDAIEQARAEVADLIGAKPDEIVFTSGGTESSNIAIRAAATKPGRGAIVTSTIEHPATDECCKWLESRGHRIRRVAPSASGHLDPRDLLAVLDDDTVLVTLIHAQNEIGTLQPIADVAHVARSRAALVHADAAQSVGKIPLDVEALGVDLLSIAGHKLYAPKGIGALYVRRGTGLPALLMGAGQEHGQRAGTENVASIVGLGAACRLASRWLPDGARAMRDLSRAFLSLLQIEVPGLRLLGDLEGGLPNTLSVLFPGASGRMVLEACPDVMASTGSACHAGNEEASSIVTGLGIPHEAALGMVRLSLGRSTTLADITTAASALGVAWRCVVA